MVDDHPETICFNLVIENLIFSSIAPDILTDWEYAEFQSRNRESYLFKMFFRQLRVVFRNRLVSIS